MQDLQAKFPPNETIGLIRGALGFWRDHIERQMLPSRHPIFAPMSFTFGFPSSVVQGISFTEDWFENRANCTKPLKRPRVETLKMCEDWPQPLIEKLSFA